MRAHANAIRERLHVDTTGWRGLTEPVHALPVVQEAVARDRKLAFQYRKPDGELSERTVEPLGLVAKGSAWYLVANTSEGFRTFRVSRIDEASVLDLSSPRPPGFDLAAHWKLSTDQLRESRKRYKVTLRVEPRAAERFLFWGYAPVRGVPNRGGGGWVTRDVDFDDEDQACFVVLGLGPRAEVLAPAGLRARVAKDLAEVIRRARPTRTRVRRTGPS